MTPSKKTSAKASATAATSKGAAKKKAAATKATNTKAAGKPAASTGAAKKSAKSTKATTKKASVTKAPAKKATGNSTGRKKSPFSAKFLDQMEKLLHTERETYERQAAMLRAEAESLVADLDPGDVQFDEESGEGDTIAVERNRDLALASKAVEMIEEIDRALAKFATGDYGICEVSGEPIPNERLEAIPWAREKVEYKVGGFGRR